MEFVLWCAGDTSLTVVCRVKIMFNHINPKNGQKAPLIADDVFAIIMEVRKGAFNLIITIYF